MHSGIAVSVRRRGRNERRAPDEAVAVLTGHGQNQVSRLTRGNAGDFGENK
jgi:hypothetical protein